MNLEIWDKDKSSKFLRRPSADDHKYSRGVVAFITGSSKFPGAALLNTKSALASGVGMVRYLGPKSVKKLVLLSTPEVVIAPGRTDVFVMGSGVLNKGALFIRRKMKKQVGLKAPLVLDAGALDLSPMAHELTVITPHSAELAQLLVSLGISVGPDEIAADPEKWAKAAADKLNLTVLLKGHITYVANPRKVIKLPPAPSQLATAGTGDILSGLLGGLMAINHEILTGENLIEVAATAALVQANAASQLLQGSPRAPISLENLIEQIPAAISQLS